MPENLARSADAHGHLTCRCAFAALAQFYPQKYPDNWVLLVVCVLGYMAGTGILNFYVAGREGDAFMFTRRRKVSQASAYLM